MKEQDTRTVYGDIIDLPHHQSLTRKHMSLYDRAAQFAPFAALSGYDDMVIEEARLTSSEIQLSDFEIDMLNQRIMLLEDQLSRGEHPRISVTYFVPDAFKAGGQYETVIQRIKRIDTVERKLILYGSDNIEDKRISPIEISIEKVIAIDSPSSE